MAGERETGAVGQSRAGRSAGRTVLLVQCKRLGDAILAEPLVRSLRSAGWRVTWLDRLVNRPAAELLGADEVLWWSEGIGAIGALLRLRRAKFDAVADLGGTDRCALIGAFCGARRKFAYAKYSHTWLRRVAGFSFVSSKVWSQHTVDHFLKMGEALGAGGVEPLYPVVALTRRDLEAARALRARRAIRQDYIVLHLGAARTEKFWHLPGWEKVSRSIREKYGWEVVLTGGNGEEEKQQREELVRRVPGLIDVGGECDLAVTAALYAGARLVVTVDSMSGHLAPAVGARTLVLFGPMNPYHWGPRQPGCRALRGGHAGGGYLPQDPEGRMEDLGPEEVMRVMEEMISTELRPASG